MAGVGLRRGGMGRRSEGGGCTGRAAAAAGGVATGETLPHTSNTNDAIETSVMQLNYIYANYSCTVRCLIITV